MATIPTHTCYAVSLVYHTPKWEKRRSVTDLTHAMTEHSTSTCTNDSVHGRIKHMRTEIVSASVVFIGKSKQAALSDLILRL